MTLPSARPEVVPAAKPRIGAIDVGVLGRRLMPLGGWAIVMSSGLLLGPPPAQPSWYAIGAGVLLIVALVAPFARPSRQIRGGELGPAILFLLAVGALRHGLGGAASGLGPLAVAPILWLGLFASRREIGVGLATLAFVFILPILLVGGPAYPDSEWRRLATLLGVSGAAGFAINGLVAEVRRQQHLARDQAARLADEVAISETIVETADDAVISFDATGRIFRWNASAARMLGWGDRSPAGVDLIDTFVEPTARPRIRAGFERLLAALDASDAEGGALRVFDGSRFETEMVRLDGSTVPIEATVGAAGPKGQRRIHAFARDITERRDADLASQTHRDDLARLLSVARDLGRPAAATDGREAICHAARELAGADLALFFESRPDEGLLVSTGGSGDGRVPERIALDGDHSLTARIYASGEAAFVGDLAADVRVDRATAARMDVRAAYWQPVIRDGVPIGVLVVYWRTPQKAVSERVQSLLELFAAQAAVVVERADLMARLESLARTDPLTGLANRRALEETLLRQLASAERSRRPLSIVMLDLDHFKQFNDDRGHQAGDDLLREVAAAWLTELRPSDTLARFGGEEFLAILPACDGASALAIADRLRGRMPDRESASAGVATWDFEETMSGLIARADGALYEAKGGGRDRTERADAAPPPPDSSPRPVRSRRSPGATRIAS